MRFPTKHAAAASIAAATTITALAGTALAGTALTGTALAAQRQGSARVLGAGQTGTAAQVPWRQVGPGWELVQYDATTDTAGHIKPGPQTLYLVDPAGGRYQMYQWPAKAAVQPILADWSGDKARALFTEGTNVVQQLNLRTSQITSIRLARAQFLAYASYTRPAGSSIVVANGNTQRVTIDSLRGSVLRSLGANSQNAIQSADGRQYVLPGGSGLRLTSSSGKLIRRLPVPGAGCLPVRYWSASTVLASCQVNRNGTAGRLWLVPLNRRAPSAITSARVRMPVIANLDAWRLRSSLYVQSAGACGTEFITREDRNGSQSVVNVPGTNGQHNVVVTAANSRLLVQAGTGCEPSSSLLWFNPATHAEQWLFRTARTVFGVVAVVPFYGRQNRPAFQ